MILTPRRKSPTLTLPTRFFRELRRAPKRNLPPRRLIAEPDRYRVNRQG